MLAVVAAELTAAGELAFQRPPFDNTEAGIHPISDRFVECQVCEAFMESTARVLENVMARVRGKVPVAFSSSHV